MANSPTVIIKWLDNKKIPITWGMKISANLKFYTHENMFLKSRLTGDG